VKILETLARETVRTLTGSSRYVDPLPEHDEAGEVVGVTKLRYDPLFTFLDLLADPAYYVDRPLIHVEHLPLRRSLVTATVESKSSQERWMTLTRLSPSMIASGLPQVMGASEVDAERAQAAQRVQTAFRLYQAGHNNLLLVAPESTEERWRHISTLGAGAEATTAIASLGIAWRNGDEAGVEAAAQTLARALPQINPDTYPTWRRDLEARYNALRPFEIGAWLYGASLLLLILAFGTGRRWLIIGGVGTLAAALLLHVAGFGTRWVIAERLPIQNQFESMTGLAFGGAMVGAVLMLLRRQWLFGAASAAVGFLTLLAATQTGIPGVEIGREAAILNTSYLLKYHVTTVLVSYGLITLGAAVSAFYLLAHYGGGRGADASESASIGVAAQALGAGEGAAPSRRRLLDDLDRAQTIVLQLAFWTLGVGILLGAWWADHSWGRWWAFDPKETWAPATWIIYLIVIHVRMVAKRRELVTAWLSVLGFAVMIWTYFGVNLLLSGLHSYA